MKIKNEIKAAIIEAIYNGTINNDNIEDLHYYLNEDYHCIGYYQSICWIEDNFQDIFEGIKVIQDYELDNFGEIHTDFSGPEDIANMLYYIESEVYISYLGDFQNLDELKKLLKIK